MKHMMFLGGLLVTGTSESTPEISKIGMTTTFELTTGKFQNINDKFLRMILGLTVEVRIELKL